MRVADIVDIMDRIAPPILTDSWDNTGLQLGNIEKEVKKVLVSLDLDEVTLKKAKEVGADMIITHHPLIFKPLEKITSESYKGKIILDIIKEDMAVFSAHTNLDIVDGGVNDVFAELMGLEDVEVLKCTQKESLLKLVIYVPKDYSDRIRDVLGKSGAGWVGNYSHCTYNVNGFGTFMPHSGTNPFIGSENKLEIVEETRVETIVKESNLNFVLYEILKVHPYEEVAYDIYPLENQGVQYGYGRVGNIDETPVSNFLNKLKEKLEVKNLKVFGKIDGNVSRIAFCGGSGGDFIQDAYDKSADLYITGDIKYHEAQLANELNLLLIDAGHYNTEKIILPKIKKKLEQLTNNEIEVIINSHSTAPFLIY